jgi:hypothetical protein
LLIVNLRRTAVSFREIPCFETDSRTTEAEERYLRHQGYFPAVTTQAGMTFWLPTNTSPDPPKRPDYTGMTPEQIERGKQEDREEDDQELCK